MAAMRASFAGRAHARMAGWPGAALSML
jgi:hypothetical protein